MHVFQIPVHDSDTYDSVIDCIFGGECVTERVIIITIGCTLLLMVIIALIYVYKRRFGCIHLCCSIMLSFVSMISINCGQYRSLHS